MENQLTRLQSIAEVVAVVRVVEAIKRRPVPIKKTITFFSKYDLWMYTAILDDRLCNVCLGFEKIPRFFGDQLRTLFPYLDIVGVDKILAKVHPNCRCTLDRVAEWTLDDVKWFLSRR